MADPRSILCGGVSPPARARAGPPPVRLAIGAGRRDVHLRLSQLSDALVSGLPPVAADLVELAAYVYAADQAVTRGGTAEFEYGEKWHRRLRFEVAVRRPEVWNRPAVREALEAALGFLTDDEYAFRFHPAANPSRLQTYLLDALPPGTDGGVEEVMLFSGGLDSLCGAVQEVLVGERRVALVSHRPVGAVHARQRALAETIAGRQRAGRAAPVQVGVRVNKGKVLGRDFTQRSRSFLFGAIAAVSARAFGLSRIRFYENGVTSLNLPISPQLIGGRASRTTHPQTLARFAHLFSTLFETGFVVHNPFQWRTKADILRQLAAAGHADLCGRTSSCVHTWTRTEAHPHCGRCSQCVDRRLSALAAGLAAEDPAAGYESDVLTGGRAGADLILVERMVGAVREVERLASPVALAARYGELAHVLTHTGQPADAAARAVFQLARAHAGDVRRVLERHVATQSRDLVGRTIPPDSLVGVALGLGPGPAAGPARDPAAESPHTTLEVDPAAFEVRAGGAACFLGNTNEFAFVARLAKAAGRFVSTPALGADVWDDAGVGKNTIQKTVSNIRRKFRGTDLAAVEIDGSQRGHYRFVLPQGWVVRVSDFSADRPAGCQRAGAE